MLGVDELPAGWRTRRPTLDDVPAILAVVHASDIAAVGAPDFSADDVAEALTGPGADPALDSWLALAGDGEVVGWGYLENPARGPRDFVEVYVHPDRGLPAQRPLLNLLLARVAERAAATGRESLTARAGAIPTERHWIDVLTGAGFAFVKRYARMRRTLAGVDPTPPPPPPGVTIRPIGRYDDADLRLMHRIIQEAFADTPDHQRIGYPDWREQIGAQPGVSWDEWFLADVDGVAAGALQSADQALDQNEGWVKMLGVLRAYRRRGVGAALLRHAFARYAAKGRTYAGLGVDLANPTEAVRLYLDVGLVPLYEADMFEWTVPAYGAAVRVGRERRSAT
jgi:mycothiol synthase